MIVVSVSVESRNESRTLFRGLDVDTDESVWFVLDAARSDAVVKALDKQGDEFEIDVLRSGGTIVQ